MMYEETVYCCPQCETDNLYVETIEDPTSGETMSYGECQLCGYEYY